MSTQVRTSDDPGPWDHEDAELLLRLIQSTEDYAVIALDRTGRIRTWNPAAERLLGYAASEAVGQPIGLIFTEEDRAARRPEQEMAEAAATGRAEDTRWHRRRDGSRIWVRGTAAALRDETGALLGYGKILRDAGELRADQEEMRRLVATLETERVRIAAVLEQLPAGLAIAEAPSGRLLYHNREAERLLGHPMRAVPDYIGYVRYGALHDDGTPYRPDEYPIARALMLGETVNQEPMRYRRGDGAETVLMVSAAPVRDPDGAIAAAISTFYDSSGQRAFDDRLWHTQKLESVGVLAGGIAHDFNNLLTSILGNVHLALRGLPPEAARRAEPMLRDAIHAAERGADLTRQLLAYAGKGGFQLGPVDLCGLIQEMTQLFRTTMSRLIELRLDLSGECGPIQGDRAQLKQLLLALVTNAAEAIGSHTGMITIRVQIDELAERAPRAELMEPPPNGGRYVRLEVADSGVGMDADTRGRIFDPFFTTKFLGRGLGLSAALGIVRAHRGVIHLDTEPGRGSKFTVLLPTAQPRPPRAELVGGITDAETRGALLSRGAVLLVEDEEPVRAFMQRVLERLGLDVLPAADGAEALRVLEVTAGRGPDRAPRLVILDLAIPAVEGAEVASIIRQRWPAIPIMVCSGSGDPKMLERASSPSIAAVLPKPFAPELLAAEVERVLRGGRG